MEATEENDKVCAGYFRGEGILADIALWVHPRVLRYKITINPEELSRPVKGLLGLLLANGNIH